MSAPGRPKRESIERSEIGCLISVPGRPKSESFECSEKVAR